jgi:hypothetical protein
MLSAQMNQQEFLWHLMGAGDETQWAAIQSAFNLGGNVLSTGGVEVARLDIVETNTRTITAAALTSIAPWVLPNVTYYGRPLTFELDLPSITHSALPATVSFEIRASVNGGAAFKVCTASVPLPAGTVSQKFNMSGTLPVAGQLALNVGDVISGINVFASTSAPTATINTFWNNGSVGSTPGRLRVVQQ